MDISEFIGHNLQRGFKTIDGITFPVAKMAMVSDCILEVEVGTSGKNDNQYSNTRTYFRLKDISDGNTMMSSYVEGEGGCKEVAIAFKGNAELDCFIGALEFALRQLKEFGG